VVKNKIPQKVYLANLENAITLQTIELELCSNLQRILPLKSSEIDISSKFGVSSKFEV